MRPSIHILRGLRFRLTLTYVLLFGVVLVGIGLGYRYFLQQEIRDEVLATLTPREEKVIKMRFGLGTTGSEHTLEEVGQHFAVTRERIRQIEAKALRKLRHPSRSRKLKAFLDGAPR